MTDREKPKDAVIRMALVTKATRACRESPMCGYVATCPGCDGCDLHCVCCSRCGSPDEPCECISRDDYYRENE